MAGMTNIISAVFKTTGDAAAVTTAGTISGKQVWSNKWNNNRWSKTRNNSWSNNLNNRWNSRRSNRWSKCAVCMLQGWLPEAPMAAGSSCVLCFRGAWHLYFRVCCPSFFCVWLCNNRWSNSWKNSWKSGWKNTGNNK